MHLENAPSIEQPRKSQWNWDDDDPHAVTDNNAVLLIDLKLMMFNSRLFISNK